MPRKLEMLIPESLPSLGQSFRDLTGSAIRFPYALPVPPAIVPVKATSRAAIDNLALDGVVNNFVRRNHGVAPEQANAYLRGTPIREKEMVYYPISFYRI